MGLTGWGVGARWTLIAWLWLACVGAVLSIIDVEHHRLPDRLTLPSYLVVGIALLIPALAYGQWGFYLRAWFAALAMFIAYFLLALINPAGMGMGTSSSRECWAWPLAISGGHLCSLASSQRSLLVPRRYQFDDFRQGKPEVPDPIWALHVHRCVGVIAVHPSRHDVLHIGLGPYQRGTTDSRRETLSIMLRWLTAGESHGPALVAILEGL